MEGNIIEFDPSSWIVRVLFAWYRFGFGIKSARKNEKWEGWLIRSVGGLLAIFCQRKFGLKAPFIHGKSCYDPPVSSLFDTGLIFTLTPSDFKPTTRTDGSWRVYNSWRVLIRNSTKWDSLVWACLTVDTFNSFSFGIIFYSCNCQHVALLVECWCPSVRSITNQTFKYHGASQAYDASTKDGISGGKSKEGHPKG